MPAARDLPLAVDDAAAAQIVWGDLDFDPIARIDPDPIPAHLARRVAECLVPVVQKDFVHAASERLDHRALELYLLFLLCHGASDSSPARARKGENWTRVRAPTAALATRSPAEAGLSSSGGRI